MRSRFSAQRINMFFVYILIILVCLAALYLFLISPRTSKRNDFKALIRDYAHRGLHGGEIIENTCEAFENACKNGFGMELDVQLSSDGEVIVLHDYDTDRVCKECRSVASTGASTLVSLEMTNGASHIPLFKDVLETVCGRAPLLIELKGESFDTRLCGKLHELLTGYDGEYCVESFNPMLLREFKRLEPDTACGILSCNMTEFKKMHFLLRFALQNLLLNFLCRPDFIAYKFSDKCLSLDICHALGAKKLLWTPKGEAECTAARQQADAIIFENEV